LLAAAYDGHSELVRLLIEEGKASADQADHDGETPLLNAMYEGHHDIVRFLIREGNASVEQANKEGQTPLLSAIERCSELGFECDMDMLRWLVEEGNANVNASGGMPLLFALRAEVVNIEVVRFLLSVGACVEDLDDPAFNSYAKASIQEEVQKLEIHCTFFYLRYHVLPKLRSSILNILQYASFHV
jgi:hypothetical protein